MNEYCMDWLEKIKEETDIFKKHLLFSVWITNTLKEKGYNLPIVVGGSAVEIYISPFYVSGDIDFVFPNRKEFEDIILSTGLFKKQGKNYISDELGIFAEIVDDELSGSLSKVREIKVEIEGKEYAINVIGIEDLIIDRLNACVHWKSESDCELAQILLRGYEKELDIDYLQKRAKEERVENKLREIIEEIENEDKIGGNNSEKDREIHRTQEKGL